MLKPVRQLFALAPLALACGLAWGQSADFKAGYDSMVAFRGENLLWWQVAELSFDSFMNRLKAR